MSLHDGAEHGEAGFADLDTTGPNGLALSWFLEVFISAKERLGWASHCRACLTLSNCGRLKGR